MDRASLGILKQMRLHGASISGSLEKAGFLSAFVSNIFSLFSSSFFHVHCQFRTTRRRVPKIPLFIYCAQKCPSIHVSRNARTHFFAFLQKHGILRRFTLQHTSYNITVCRFSASFRCQNTIRFSQSLF
jgi:hypothetical protein